MDRGIPWRPDFSREAATFDLTAMRHRLCGKVCLYVNTEFVLNPQALPMAYMFFLPNGSEPVAGRTTRCPHCGFALTFTPHTLDVDRGPDRRESKWQELALGLAYRILNGARS